MLTASSYNARCEDKASAYETWLPERDVNLQNDTQCNCYVGMFSTKQNKEHAYS